MHLLVTGAAGFIASRAEDLLLAAGHTVTGAMMVSHVPPPLRGGNA